MASTQVFDARLIEHIAANLVTPANVAFGVLQLLLRGLTNAQLVLVQARAQAFPRDVTVAVLAAAVLTLHDDAGRNVGQTNGRIRLVDVLTTRPAGAEGVGTHIRRIDVNFDGVIDFGIHKHRRERGVTTRIAIERTLANEAVDAGFGAQITIGKIAGELDRRALQTSHVAVRLLKDFHLEPATFAVAAIHAKQHLRPVLRLGTTRA